VFNGMRAETVQYSQRGRSLSARAHKRIILCGGTINSPQLLELSGVGQANRLQGLGITPVHDSRGVGENLQDHLLVAMVYGCAPEVSINREVSGWRLLPTALKWLLLRDGPLTTGSAPVGGFFYTREGLDAPDVQLHFASGATLYNEAGKIRPTEAPGMTTVVNQSRPESRGHLHIKSVDASVHPAIVPNYLSAEIDRATLLAAVRFMTDVFESPALAPYRLARVAPAAGQDSDEEIMAHIRSTANTVYHPVGTCKMGSDADAVVDDRLQVRGVEGLMVADASVMPTLVSGNTNAASIMIGEKAADFLLA
jgi:choline dehydrogenase